MTISGGIQTAIFGWDDGGTDFNGGAPFGPPNRSSDVTVTDNWGAASNVSIDGRAKINSDLEGLYRFRFDMKGSGSGSSATNGPTQAGQRSTTSDDITAKEHYIGIRSATLGAITIGRRGVVHGSAAKVDVTGNLGLANNVDPLAYGSNLKGRLTNNALAQNGTNVHFVATDGDGGYTDRNNIRYDSPTWAGFVLSADWGQQSDNTTTTGFGAPATNDEDYYSVRISYANQFGDFKLVGAAAYWAEDNVGPVAGANAVTNERSGVLGSIGIMHVPTGLFVNAGAGETDLDAKDPLTGNTVTCDSIAGGVNSVSCGDPSFWYVTGGISQNWTGWGATTLFGTYYSSSDNNDGDLGFIAGANGVASHGVRNDNFDSMYYSLGIVQNIDAASMKLFFNYRHLETDAQYFSQGAFRAVEDLDVWGAGAIIKF